MRYGKNLIMTACIALLFLMGCAHRDAEKITNQPKPQYGIWGLDTAGQDTSASLGNDFFRYTNGAWLDRTPIPSDKPGISLRLLMTDRTEARLHEIMESAAAKATHEPADLEGKVGAFYKAFMDENRVEQLGANPISAELDQVRATKTPRDIGALMGHSANDFEISLFGFYVDVDLKDPTRYAFYLTQSGLGLPDRDYYLKPDFAAQKMKYESHVAQLLHLIDWPEADARARDVAAFETAVANVSWTKVQQRDPVATYNPMTIEELKKFVPGFAWDELLAGANMAQVNRVIVSEKSAFPKIGEVFEKTPITTLQAWQAFHMADAASPFLSKAFADAYFEMHDKTLAGQQEQTVRWKRAVAAVSGGDFLASTGFGTYGTMGYGVGQLYSAKYFGPDAKAKIESLVANVKAAYRARLEKLDWMGPATKAEALKKLDTYNIKVGYPDHPRDYSKLVIRDDDLAGNVRRCVEADWAYSSGRILSPVDKSEWGMTPQTNDAYNGNLRDIVFPAGILQAPMFDVAADPAINYGAIGAVIGHELTHGFDDQGRKIDAAGALRDWWTKDDADKFEARARMLAAQYSSFEPIPGVHVNGDLTMGENIADLGGLSMALDAYHASLNGKPAPFTDGFSGDQRVFLGWAQAWRGKFNDDYLRRQVVSDPHSPRQFRVNGVVRNIDAWYEAFGVKAGDTLYVQPDQRVHIW
jgi:putative endopeptidase